MRRALLVFALLAALILAASAAATIVPQKGIGGITLAMTQAQVREKLGDPKSRKTGTNEFGKYVIYYYARIRVTFQGLDTATQVDTTSPLEKTAGGIGVGSTKAQVKAGIAGVKCEPGHCHVGAFLPGKRVTDFFIGASGRVTRVVVGIVID